MKQWKKAETFPSSKTHRKTRQFHRLLKRFVGLDARLSFCLKEPSFNLKNETSTEILIASTIV